mmetsp:Transcript_170807/g.542744  ORF Transcript_170807/g.542744 Transcript_170807/m.542744 type:complete len:559 (-) Transcript_170807:180-1856(-)|eukprot:CAMPEP_0203978086 /NCGR_PEP_ID=MMETSP0359-20131031/101940_1 /ASSEMBLY_ACC=CAM_ASM_000338 /TAXON_ID=268821 /ORGANISM="Scrippsiella Hangoei, Strain SHTV-5" /LENGTH=558 /DNA_ID=CAMNT_0050916295 /DNA_START=39 /DNA_END=1715 /DNA_ORIENTATION=-
MAERSKVEVCESPTGGGCCLRATCDVKRGETLLVEPPCFMTDHFDERAVVDFLTLPAARQDLILGSFFCPMGSDKTAGIRARVTGTAEDSDRAVQFETILMFNCFDCTLVLDDGSGNDDQYDDRVAIYSVASKANHSCEPNASWYTRDVLGTRIVRSLAAIRKGEEVLISYLRNFDLLLPTSERRQILQTHTEFFCECSLCSSLVDRARVFPCALSLCPGARRAVVHGGASECDVCAKVFVEASFSEMLGEEASLCDNLDRIDLALQGSEGHDGDISAEILALRTIHPLHHTTRRIGRLQYDLHTRLHHRADAARALALIASHWPDCSSSSPSSSPANAFDLERLGDGFRRAGDFGRAEEMYDRAWKAQVVLRELLHPYVACCMRKLASVRLRLPAAETNELLALGTLVVLRGLPDRRSNGVVGHVGLLQDGLYTVHMGAESVPVAVSNLSSALLAIAPLILVLGQLVLVHGLTSAAGQALNGRIGTVEAFGQGRVVVRGIRRGWGVADLAAENIVVVDELEVASMHGVICPASRDEGVDTDSETDEEEEEEDEEDEL